MANHSFAYDRCKLPAQILVKIVHAFSLLMIAVNYLHKFWSRIPAKRQMCAALQYLRKTTLPILPAFRREHRDYDRKTTLNNLHRQRDNIPKNPLLSHMRKRNKTTMKVCRVHPFTQGFKTDYKLTTHEILN